MNEQLDLIDKLIMDQIKKSDKGLNTYELGKIINLSWSTTNIHCFRLQAMNKLTNKLHSNLTQRRKRVWRIKK